MADLIAVGFKQDIYRASGYLRKEQMAKTQSMLSGGARLFKKAKYKT